MKLSSKQCIKELSKYWKERYLRFDEAAQFGCDIENEITYSWDIEIPGRKFEIQINKINGVITEIKKH